MRSGIVRACSWLWGVAFLFLSAGAVAQDMAAAEALFKEGKVLFDSGQTSLACAKFAESQRLDPSPGTLMNLAACHEKEGKAASAWAEFLAASRAAKAAGRDALAEAAVARAQGLEPSLAKLSISVSASVTGLEVLRNGEVLSAASLGSALPVDPGEHQLIARAEGYETWTGTVSVKPHEAAAVAIPPLSRKSTAEPEKPTEGKSKDVPPTLQEPTREQPASPVLAYVVGGVGLAVTGVGLTFGALAKDKYDHAVDLCPTRSGCSEAALDEREGADEFATVANVGVPIGLATLGVGVVLYLMNGTETIKEQSAISAGGTLSSGGAFAEIRGAF
ncbi:MAG: hypothetical protein RJA70_1480 [Pseudomonadota bacterium]|jgi:tetratricopeptide (TPR) repeat protein